MTASGTVSVLHHAAIYTTNPATRQASGLMRSGAGATSVSANAVGPAISQMRRAIMIGREPFLRERSL
ncbi:MAG: hypothetical protein V2J51_02945 [Erythrobacter sp.]|nr:hypothetical protein [Erythrobacter sp.]